MVCGVVCLASLVACSASSEPSPGEGLNDQQGTVETRPQASGSIEPITVRVGEQFTVTLDSSGAYGPWDLDQEPRSLFLVGSGTTPRGDGAFRQNFTFEGVAPGRETLVFSTPGGDLAHPPQVATYFITVTGDAATSGTAGVIDPTGSTPTTTAGATPSSASAPSTTTTTTARR